MKGKCYECGGLVDDDQDYCDDCWYGDLDDDSADCENEEYDDDEERSLYDDCY